MKRKYDTIKGFLLTACGVLSIFIDYDATAAVVLVPVGIYIMIKGTN